jgi:putative PIN family toxin of toxin-antitoxin system
VAVKAVVDTNIWVSSLLNPFGFPAKLRRSFAEGLFDVVISTPILEEIAEVLMRPRIRDKYEIAGDDIEGLLLLIEERAENVPISGDVAICRDKDDNLVIETAIKGGAKYLVTRDDDIKFDKAVASFMLNNGVTVISLQKFLDLISKP